MSSKIIDCFIFYNELDLLYYRLSILYPVVYAFVLVESTHTFVGKPKPLFYQENQSRFEAFQSKIIHIVVDDFPYIYPNIDIGQKQQWENEKFQRMAISRGISRFILTNEDLLLISDVDEIPNPMLLPELKRYMNNRKDKNLFNLEMTFYYYNLYTRILQKWYHPKILTYQKYIEYGSNCEMIRHSGCPSIHRSGWHLSYFGDSAFIQNKIKMFSHQEFAGDEYTDLNKIEERVKTSTDLFGRPENQIMRVSLAMNDDLPYQYEMYLKSFY